MDGWRWEMGYATVLLVNEGITFNLTANIIATYRYSKIITCAYHDHGALIQYEIFRHTSLDPFHIQLR